MCVLEATGKNSLTEETFLVSKGARECFESQISVQALLELVQPLCAESKLEWVNPTLDPPLGMPRGKNGKGNEDLGAKLKWEVDKRALKEGKTLGTNASKEP